MTRESMPIAKRRSFPAGVKDRNILLMLITFLVLDPGALRCVSSVVVVVVVAAAVEDTRARAYTRTHTLAFALALVRMRKHKRACVFVQPLGGWGWGFEDEMFVQRVE